MATHSSVLAWKIPGMEEPSGLPSVGLHRVGHDWSDLAAAAAGAQNPQSHFLWIQRSSLGQCVLITSHTHTHTFSLTHTHSHTGMCEPTLLCTHRLTVMRQIPVLTFCPKALPRLFELPQHLLSPQGEQAQGPGLTSTTQGSTTVVSGNRLFCGPRRHTCTLLPTPEG